MTPGFGRRTAIALAAALGIPQPDYHVEMLVRSALADGSANLAMPEGSDRER